VSGLSQRPFHRIIGSLLALPAMLATAQSHAEDRALTQQKAMAEVLFRDGTALSHQGRHVEACRRFESSQELDPALGTILYLADCYDRIGRTASAWIRFVEARELAHSSDQSEREQIAARRAADLERRLSRITIQVAPEARLRELSIQMNGVIVPQSSYGVPIPVDPGRSYVRASAPGRFPWYETIYVDQRASDRTVVVPALSAPVRSERMATEPRVLEKSSRPPRWVGYALGGGGLLALGTAAVLGLGAHDLNQRSEDECRGESCTAAGKSLRDRAHGAAMGSTIAAVAGGALVTAGVTWLIFVPAPPEPGEQRILALGARATPERVELRIGGAL
jgi:serine/threonine-protein kinase